jgi:hypothetical protein
MPTIFACPSRSLLSVTMTFQNPSFEPPLTTIHHYFAGQGKRCVEILRSMIQRQKFGPRFNFCGPISSFARVRRQRDDEVA